LLTFLLVAILIADVWSSWRTTTTLLASVFCCRNAFQYV